MIALGVLLPISKFLLIGLGGPAPSFGLYIDFSVCELPSCFRTEVGLPDIEDDGLEPLGVPLGVEPKRPPPVLAGMLTDLPRCFWYLFFCFLLYLRRKG